MKNVLFFIPLAALALASCSEDEPAMNTAGKGETIAFRPAMASASRAVETNNANLTSIEVTALAGTTPYFENITFSKGSDNFFTSQDDYYWPGDNTELSFIAYSPSADILGADVALDGDTLRMESFVTPESIADQVDFITANATGTKELNEAAGVPLTFEHRLAQIELRAKTDNTLYTYKVTGMRIGRAETTASYNFTTNEWSLDDWHDTNVYESSCDEVTLTSDPVSIMGEAGNAMLIPQTLTAWDPVGDPDNVAREAYLSVLINITTKDGQFQMYPFPSDTTKDASGNVRKYAWASIPLSGKWEQGKKYIYTLDFTNGAGNVDPDDPNPGHPVLGDPIKFTVQVADWEDANNDIPMTPVRK